MQIIFLHRSEIFTSTSKVQCRILVQDPYGPAGVGGRSTQLAPSSSQNAFTHLLNIIVLCFRFQGFKIRFSVVEEFGTWGPWSFLCVDSLFRVWLILGLEVCWGSNGIVLSWFGARVLLFGQEREVLQALTLLQKDIIQLCAKHRMNAPVVCHFPASVLEYLKTLQFCI